MNRQTVFVLICLAAPAPELAASQPAVIACQGKVIAQTGQAGDESLNSLCFSDLETLIFRKLGWSHA